MSVYLTNFLDRIFTRDTSHTKYYLSAFQANVLHPGARAQILRTDTPVPDPIPPYILKVNSIWLLDDFDLNNGATEVIRGSHKINSRPPREPTLENLRTLEKVVAPSGSLLITHGGLWHRSGDNQSSQVRRVLLGSYAASYCREISSEEDVVRFLHPAVKAVMNPKLFEMIGGNHGVKLGNDYCYLDVVKRCANREI